MKKKNLIALLLVVIMTIGLPLSVSAHSMSAKTIVLNSVQNFDYGYDKSFYDQSVSNSKIQIHQLDGSLVKEYQGFKGSSANLNMKYKTNDQKLAIACNFNLKGKNYSGQIFVENDKIIFTKDLLLAIQDFLPEDQKIENLNQYPKYLYITDQQIVSFWQNMAKYRDQKIPQEYKDLITFVVEAVPDNCFTIKSGNVVVNLDQEEFETVICNLLDKVQNEIERFADILVNLMKLSNSDEQLKPEVTKQEIIKGIEESVTNGSYPTKEQVKMMSVFVKVDQFIYQGSIIPGGMQNFQAKFSLQPATGSTGELVIDSSSSGTKTNLNGNQSFKLNLEVPNQFDLNVGIDGEYQYQGLKGQSQYTIISTAQNPITKELLLNTEIQLDSDAQAGNYIHVDTPNLNKYNSMDLKSLQESDKK